MVSFIASDAFWPLSSRSSIAGPSRGSVMFWLSAAPVPARVYAQRLATHDDDELTATPNWPLCLHLAAIENVTLKPYSM